MIHMLTGVVFIVASATVWDFSLLAGAVVSILAINYFDWPWSIRAGARNYAWPDKIQTGAPRD